MHKNIKKTVLTSLFSIAAIGTLSAGAFAQDGSINPVCIDKIASEVAFNGVGLVAKNGKIIYNKDIHRDGVPWSDHSTSTKFNLGSANKMFTAVAIGQLVDGGFLGFEDNIRDHMPELPEKYQGIKVSHLLTHQSGVGNYFQPKNRQAIYSAETVSDLMKLVLAEPNDFSPGERMQYSNSGFVVLGALIEKLSRQDYESYIRENILARSGMQATNLAPDERTATPFTQRSMGSMRRGEASPIDAPYRQQPLRRSSPAGGIFSTTEDMYKFSMALIEDKLMSPKTREILTSQKEGTTRENPDTGEKVGYGFGFNVGQNGEQIGHGGGSLGINAEVRIWPKRDTVIVTLANLDPPLATTFADALEGYIFGRERSCD